MALQTSGPISLNDVRGEFGGSAPDAIEEYYRGGSYVTENNTNIPSCSTGDCLINFEQFYGGELLLAKIVSTNQEDLVLSELFTEGEWTSTAPKQVTINTGITIGASSVSTVACSTGSLVNEQPMAGTLKLINNGYIYGAGGVPSSGNGGDGGSAFQALVAVTVENNGRIYAGGGAGGAGGVGCTGYYYPDTTTWRYNRAYPYFIWDDVNDQYIDGLIYWNFTLTCTHLVNCYYEVFSPPNFPTGTSYVGEDGRTYERGSLIESSANNLYYQLRRRETALYPGGIGGNGGRGQGSDGTLAAGNGGSLSNISYGGSGGQGGGWGTSGATGDAGVNTVNNSLYAIKVGNATAGYSGGLAGFYVLGSGNVTWDVTGLRLGRVG